MILFSFRISYFYNSTIFAFIFLLGTLFIKKSQYYYTYLLFKNKSIIKIFGGISILLFISLFWPIVHQTFDFGIMRAIIGQIPSFIVLIFFLAFLKSQNVSVYEAKNILFDVFFLQAVIQLLALLSPTFHHLIELGQDTKNVEISYTHYGGLRNMALASNQFFSLAAVYGSIIILYIFNLLEKNNISIKNYLFLFFYSLGVMLSGRTGFFGFLFAFLLFLLFPQISFSQKIKSILKGCCILILLIILLLLCLPSDSIFYTKIFPFAFEFVYNYIDGNGLTTESTRGLLTMLERDISLKTFFIGDGKYLNPDGSYYMHTDSGYFRIIFYYGFWGIFPFLYFQLKCCLSTLVKRKKRYRLLTLIIIIFLLFLHIKGEALGYIKYVNTVIFYFFYVSYLIEDTFYGQQHNKNYKTL